MKRYDNICLPLYDGRYFQSDLALVVDGDVRVLDGKVEEFVREAAHAGIIRYLFAEKSYCFPFFGYDGLTKFTLFALFGGNFYEPGMMSIKAPKWLHGRKASRSTVADMADFYLKYADHHRGAIPNDWTSDNELDWQAEQLADAGLERYMSQLDAEMQPSEHDERDPKTGELPLAARAQRVKTRCEFYDGSVIYLTPDGHYLPSGTSVLSGVTPEGFTVNRTIWVASEQVGTA